MEVQRKFLKKFLNTYYRLLWAKKFSCRYTNSPPNDIVDQVTTKKSIVYKFNTLNIKDKYTKRKLYGLQNFIINMNAFGIFKSVHVKIHNYFRVADSESLLKIMASGGSGPYFEWGQEREIESLKKDVEIVSSFISDPTRLQIFVIVLLQIRLGAF